MSPPSGRSCARLTQSQAMRFRKTVSHLGPVEVADQPEEALAAAESGGGRPLVIDQPEEEPDRAPRRALAGLGGFADEHGEEVAEVVGRLDREVARAADDAPEGDEELREKRDRV